jgi:MFS family permease
MLISVGEIVAGAAFGIFGSVTVKRGRDPIIMVGFVLSMIAYFLTFINLPGDANLRETDEPAFIESNTPLAIFTSFLLGFSDACFNTQVFSILGGTFRENSASAFAIMKFMQCLGASIAFWYSPVLGLYWQLLIAVIFDVLGTIAFCTVEWRRGRESLKKNEDNTCGVPQDNKVE